MLGNELTVPIHLLEPSSWELHANTRHIVCNIKKMKLSNTVTLKIRKYSVESIFKDSGLAVIILSVFLS